MSSFRFVKSERLLKRKDFLIASREAMHRVETKNFLVLLRPNQQETTRLGITVSKKIAGAIKRNRIKRHVREFFRQYKERLPQGFDMVIIARRGAADLNGGRIRDQLGALIDRII